MQYDSMQKQMCDKGNCRTKMYDCFRGLYRSMLQLFVFFLMHYTFPEVKIIGNVSILKMRMKTLILTIMKTLTGKVLHENVN